MIDSKRGLMMVGIVIVGAAAFYFLQNTPGPLTCQMAKVTDTQAQQYKDFMQSLDPSTASLLQFELASMSREINSLKHSACPGSLADIPNSHPRINIRGEVFQYVYENSWAYEYKLGINKDDRVVYYSN